MKPLYELPDDEPSYEPASPPKMMIAATPAGVARPSTADILVKSRALEERTAIAKMDEAAARLQAHIASQAPMFGIGATPPAALMNVNTSNLPAGTTAPTSSTGTFLGLRPTTWAWAGGGLALGVTLMLLATSKG